MASRRVRFRFLVVSLLLGAAPAHAVLPYGSTPPGPVQDWADYLFIGSGNCDAGNASLNDLPASFSCEGDWKLTDFRDTSDAAVFDNPQELYGVTGTGLNRAWEVSTGRPDVVIAVLDSGIRWEEPRPSLVRKYYLNRGELPLAQVGGAPAVPNPADTRFGGYDRNGDGVYNVDDYIGDARVSDLNGNGAIDPEDLIRTFSDGVDDDGNGYVDDISGWDFFEGDNNPQDDVDYGHGTGEAEDSGSEAGLDDGGCPNCMLMMLRVGDSFVADTNHFAEGVVFAVDNGAAVVQEALGTLNHTSFGQAALDFAYERGVIVNASAADEAAAHHNWPAAYEHTMVVNSVRNPGDLGGSPESYLYVNGCTNFGGYIHTSIPSTSCSSEATGRSSGVSGLLISAARNAVERGEMTSYVRDDGTQAPWALSAEEAMQLWRLAADDIDFSSPCPDHPLCAFPPPGVIPDASADNYATSVGLLVASERYRNAPGWDYFSGYGRNNAARLLRFIGRAGVEFVAGGGPFAVGDDPALSAQDRIPPEADIRSPLWWQPHPYDPGFDLLAPADPNQPGEIVVHGRAAANRVTSVGGTFDWILEWAPHVQGAGHPAAGSQAAPGSEERSGGPWTVAASGSGLSEAVDGELGRIPVSAVAAALAGQTPPFDAASDPTSPFAPERYAVRLRLRVIAQPVASADTINNEAVFQKQIDVYPASEALIATGLGAAGRRAGGTGSPSFHDLDGDGRDELLLPTSDGVVHAYTDVTNGSELPGWPVHTDVYPGVRTSGDNAFTRGDVPSDVYGALLLGTVAAADLDGDGTLEVAGGDLEGKLYVWEHDGSVRAGFPASVDRGLSQQSACGPATIPDCDDYEIAPPKRNADNTRDWGINSAPAVGDLDPAHPGLELVTGSNDGHVYAFREDGTLVPGWPVLLRDPAKVASMDAVSRFVTYAPGAQARLGTKVLVSPSLGDLDADGDLEVVIGVNEEYLETPAVTTSADPLLSIFLSLADTGNTRLYALHHTGAATPDTPASAATAHLHDQAYVAGWPAPMALLLLDLLPYVGAGTNSQAVLGDLDGDSTLEIAATSAAGMGYLFDHDGSSFLGLDGAQPRTLDFLPGDFGGGSSAVDGSSVIGLGALSLGSLDGGSSLSIAGPGAGLRRLADIQIEARQLDAEDHLSVWNASTGALESNLPWIVNDLQFFAGPIVADLDGDGNAEVIQGTAVNDLVAAGLVDDDASATRHFTGGWMTGSASLGTGPFGALDDGHLMLAAVTREGWLRLYRTDTPSDGSADCAALGEWPEYGHDAHNSGNREVDAERPYPVTDLVALVEPDDSVRLDFDATGDDRRCGTVDHYEVRAQAGLVANPDWDSASPWLVSTGPHAAPFQPETLLTPPQAAGPHTVLVRARDEAGNTSTLRSDFVDIGASDNDGDGRADTLDNCAGTANPSQADQAGVGGSGPDGTGDACQCGDVDASAGVDLRDFVVAARALSAQLPGIAAPGKCNATGAANPAPADAFGVAPDCDGSDVGRVRNALAGLLPAIEPVCAGEAE